ncbi:hypothetical protein BPAE_0378g00040 [Botrytis paeoniae]|uniref:Uncharacterized protein n=1 Tax=Botrytis paeoniae TaxID=278948 RepID=A0A4Z1F523_9HELO|nr:hypothetical protein BPAE_0378g00040 [Botrytis paeoniae]
MAPSTDYLSGDFYYKVENETWEIMRTLKMLKKMDPKENKASGTWWERKYSTDVCNALIFIMNQGDSATNKSLYSPHIPLEQAGTSRVSDDGNPKEGATNVTPPSTNDTAYRRGTSTPKLPSAPLQKTGAQPTAGSTLRSARPETCLAHRTIEGSSGDDITVAPRGASTEKPPVAQFSTASSSAAGPSNNRGTPKDVAQLIAAIVDATIVVRRIKEKIGDAEGSEEFVADIEAILDVFDRNDRISKEPMLEAAARYHDVSKGWINSMQSAFRDSPSMVETLSGNDTFVSISEDLGRVAEDYKLNSCARKAKTTAYGFNEGDTVNEQ